MRWPSTPRIWAALAARDRGPKVSAPRALERDAMAIETAGAMSPVMAFAMVGAIGVGAQWLAWRLRLPAIVLMLLAGLAIGPGLGLFDPERDIGPLMGPMISIAVAIILFEGGMTLNLHSLREAAKGVKRLVLIGAPLAWAGSALALPSI